MKATGVPLESGVQWLKIAEKADGAGEKKGTDNLLLQIVVLQTKLQNLEVTVQS